MKALAYIFSATLLSGPLIYWIVFAVFLKTRAPAAPKEQPHKYDIYSRKDRYKAIRSDLAMNHMMGILVTALPVLSIPVLGWRYRHRRALVLGLSPFALLLLALAIADAMPSVQDRTALPVLGITAAVCGLITARKDHSWQHARLVREDWLLIGSETASSARRAIRAFRLTSKLQKSGKPAEIVTATPVKEPR